jgi:hypothetical protein
MLSSIPDIAFFDFYPIFLANSPKLVLEGFTTMVILLIVNVMMEPFNMRRTDRKRSVPRLPMGIGERRML